MCSLRKEPHLDQLIKKFNNILFKTQKLTFALYLNIILYGFLLVIHPFTQKPYLFVDKRVLCIHLLPTSPTTYPYLSPQSNINDETQANIYPPYTCYLCQQ